MKNLLFAFLLSFPAFCYGQKDETMELWYQKDCYKFVLTKFANHAGTLKETSDKLLKADTKTIYIIKTEFTDSLPAHIGAYDIKYVDANSAQPMLYQEQKEHHAVILYLSKILNHYDFYSFWMLPVKAKKHELQYAEKGCSFTFEYNMGTSKFEHRQTECSK